MRLRRIYAENFMSFGKLDIRFPNDIDTFLIFGDNQDESGTNSNGSGKSNLVNVIGYTLLKKLSGKLTASEVFRDLPDGSVAEGGFTHCEWDNQGVPVIIRREFGKGHSKKKRGFESVGKSLHVNVGGRDESRRKDDETQAWLLQYLGLPKDPKTAYEDFRNRAHMAREGVSAFMDPETGPTARAALVARAAKLEELDRGKDAAKASRAEAERELELIEGSIGFATPEEHEPDRISEMEENVKHLESERNQLRRGLESVIESIGALASREESLSRIQSLGRERDAYQESSLEVMESLGGEFDSVEEEIAEIEARLEKELSVKKELMQISGEIKKEQAKADPLAEKIGRLDGERSALDPQCQKHQRDIRRARKNVALTCPECDASLLMESDGKTLVTFDATACKKLIEELDGKIRAIGRKKNELLAEINEARTERSGHTHKIGIHESRRTVLGRELTLIEQGKAKLSSLEEKLKDLDKRGQAKSQEIESRVAEFDEQIEALRSESDEDVLEQLQVLKAQREQTERAIEAADEQISDTNVKIRETVRAKKTIAELEESKKPYLEQLEIAEFWEKAFPTIRRWRIDAFLPRLEEACNKQLEQMGVGQRVVFNTLKEVKSKRDDDGNPMLKSGFEVIVQDGLVTRPIKKVNAGHRQRLALAAAMALRSLAKSRFEFLFIDEVVDVMDETGMAILLAILDGQSFIVSHKGLSLQKGQASITVTRRNKVSTAALKVA